jgi:RNA polymerase sigma-70 factor (ECF subfamily)
LVTLLLRLLHQFAIVAIKPKLAASATFSAVVPVQCNPHAPRADCHHAERDGYTGVALDDRRRGAKPLMPSREFHKMDQARVRFLLRQGYQTMDDGSAVTRASLLSRLRREPADKSAWDEFVQRYRPQILSWCQRWRLQDADAQEVTQMVLVRLAVKMRTFAYDPERRFRAWLMTLTRHAWSDLIADQQRAPLGSGAIHNVERLQTLEARNDLEARLAEAFDLELLELATDRVRARFQESTWQAFQLTAMEGLSGLEAASRLKMSVASVFKAKSNVQKRLREEIERLDTEWSP